MLMTMIDIVVVVIAVCVFLFGSLASCDNLFVFENEQHNKCYCEVYEKQQMFHDRFQYRCSIDLRALIR
jgi:hypothetical protein